MFLARAVSGEWETQAGLCWIEKELAVEQGGAACHPAPAALWGGGQCSWLWALGAGQRGSKDFFSPVISPPFVW